MTSPGSGRQAANSARALFFENLSAKSRTIKLKPLSLTEVLI